MIKEELIETKLIDLCKQILNLDYIDRDLSFFSLGGNSLLSIYFLSGIMDTFEINLAVDNIFQNISIRELASVIYKKLKKQNTKLNIQQKSTNKLLKSNKTESKLGFDQKTKFGAPVSITGNRFSYFLKINNSLDYWQVSTPVLEFDTFVDIKDIKEVVHYLILVHDVLRMRLVKNSSGWKQYIADIDKTSCLEHILYSPSTSSEQEHLNFVNNQISLVRSNMKLHDDLFKVIFIEGLPNNKTIIYLLFHHLLVDAYSFRMLVNDFFKFLQIISNEKNIDLPRKTTSYKDYTTYYIEYLKQVEIQEFRYWESFQWDLIKPLFQTADLSNNIEGLTVNVVEAVNVINKNEFLSSFQTDKLCNLTNILLCAITRAYEQWTRHPLLYLGMVFHGRLPFVDGMDLTRTAGWISETIPLFLPTNSSFNELIDKINQQVSYANCKGKSFNYLKFISKNKKIRSKMRDYPLPEISLNFISPSIKDFDFSNMVKKSETYKTNFDLNTSAGRVYLIRGGAYLREDKFHISWDYSSALFENSSVQKFAKHCMSEFINLINMTGINCGISIL